MKTLSVMLAFSVVVISSLSGQDAWESRFEKITDICGTQQELENASNHEISTMTQYLFSLPGNTLSQESIRQVLSRYFLSKALLSDVASDLRAKFDIRGLDYVLDAIENSRFEAISKRVHRSLIQDDQSSSVVGIERPIEQFSLYDSQLEISNQFLLSYERSIMSSYDYLESFSSNKEQAQLLESEKKRQLSDKSVPSKLLNALRIAFEIQFAGVSDSDFEFYLAQIGKGNGEGFFKAYTKALYDCLSVAFAKSIVDLEEMI